MQCSKVLVKIVRQFLQLYCCYNYYLVPIKNDDLWRAVRDNKPSEVKRLLKAGANPNHVLVNMNIMSVSNYCFLLQYGQSVLHIAIESGSNDIISILLSTNIDLYILDVSKIYIYFIKFGMLTAQLFLFTTWTHSQC